MAENMHHKETDFCLVGKAHGSWQCVAGLGSGTFSMIYVWSNIKDELVEKITTKQPRVPEGDIATLKRVLF